MLTYTHFVFGHAFFEKYPDIKMCILCKILLDQSVIELFMNVFLFQCLKQNFLPTIFDHIYLF